MKNKIVLISDFDGTISKKDFFHMVIGELLQDKQNMLKPWEDYLAGKIKHIDALSGIFSQIHLSQEALDNFISTIEIDKYFYDTAQFCFDNNIPFYICSAGTNYYIKKRIPAELKKYNIVLISNDAEYCPETGMKLIAPSEDSYYYNANTGISKQAIVKKFKDDDFVTIYAGDGKPDLKAAKLADIIFAKDLLLELCKKENIKTENFYTFNDILSFLKMSFAH